MCVCFGHVSSLRVKVADSDSDRWSSISGLQHQHHMALIGGFYALQQQNIFWPLHLEFQNDILSLINLNNVKQIWRTHMAMAEFSLSLSLKHWQTVQLHLHLLCIELIRLLIVACGMLVRSSSMTVRSCWILVGTGKRCRIHAQWMTCPVSILAMKELGCFQRPVIVYRSLQHGAVHYHAAT